jgi:hypothetical protein
MRSRTSVERPGPRRRWNPQASGRPSPRAAPRRRRREHRQLVGTGEGGVREVHGGQVGAVRPDERGQQHQVVVLHQHHRIAGGLGHDHLGEGQVHRPVRVPGGPPPGVEARPPGQVEQVVVHEPERRVAHDVVGHAVLLGVEVDEAQREPLGRDGARGGDGALGVGHGGRDPQGVGACDERGDARHQPAGAAPGDRRAGIVVAERHRAPVRHQHDRPLGDTGGIGGTGVVGGRPRIDGHVGQGSRHLDGRCPAAGVGAGSVALGRLRRRRSGRCIRR